MLGEFDDSLSGAEAERPSGAAFVAEAAGVRAAAHDFDVDSFVDGLDVGDDGFGGGGDGVEVADEGFDDGHGQVGLFGGDGVDFAVVAVADVVEAWHVDEVEAFGEFGELVVAASGVLSDLAEEVDEGGQGGFGFAEDGEVDQVCEGFGVVGLRAADEDERVVVGAFGCGQRDAGEVEHFDDVGVEHFVLDAEGDQVEVAERAVGFEGVEWEVGVSESVGGVGPGAEGSFAEDAGDGVEDVVDDVDGEGRAADGVGVGKGEGYAQVGGVPVLADHVDFAADVLGWVSDEGPEFIFEFVGCGHKVFYRRASGSGLCVVWVRG